MKSLDKKKTKELDWEKEFNDKWGGNVADYQRFFHIDDEPDNDRENIKDFIKFLLTQQRTELLDEILNLECLKEEKITKNIFSITQLEARNKLRNEIKSEIEKL